MVSRFRQLRDVQLRIELGKASQTRGPDTDILCSRITVLKDGLTNKLTERV